MDEKRFFFKNGDGAEYEVIFRKPNKKYFGSDCDGVCACPEEKSPKIQINPHRTSQTQLNTSIHEFTHAFFWEKSEKDVSHFASTLSRFLYNYCGWRMPSPAKQKRTRSNKKGKK